MNALYGCVVRALSRLGCHDCWQLFACGTTSAFTRALRYEEETVSALGGDDSEALAQRIMAATSAALQHTQQLVVARNSPVDCTEGASSRRAAAVPALSSGSGARTGEPCAAGAHLRQRRQDAPGAARHCTGGGGQAASRRGCGAAGGEREAEPARGRAATRAGSGSHGGRGCHETLALHTRVVAYGHAEATRSSTNGASDTSGYVCSAVSPA
jgi:hypothetical protein